MAHGFKQVAADTRGKTTKMYEARVMVGIQRLSANLLVCPQHSRAEIAGITSRRW
jgi:hypothetical protein